MSLYHSPVKEGLFYYLSWHKFNFPPGLEQNRVSE